MFDRLAKVKIRWQSKKLQIQGAQILRNEVYLRYSAMTKDAAERRSWTFYKAIMFGLTDILLPVQLTLVLFPG